MFQKAAERALFFMRPLMTARKYLQIKGFIYIGYFPNLCRPSTFSEHILSKKLDAPSDLEKQVADKYRVREYVRAVGQDGILNPLYDVLDRPYVPFDSLPDKFAFKANHGAGLNAFVSDKSAYSKEKLEKLARNWLQIDYSQITRSMETQYSGFKKRILIERLLVDRAYGTPLDYKFFCFGGKPLCVQVDIDRFGRHTRNMYSPSWELLPFTLHYPKGRSLPAPKLLTQMVKTAETLSSKFEFCRVDLYSPNDEDVVFGEITLFPGGGCETFKPKSWDAVLGRYWPQ